MTTRKQATGKRRCNGRVKKLNDEAFQLVEARANEIAEALMEATKKGNVMSARLLLELAGGSGDPENARSKEPIRSLALRLAKQPQLPPETLQETEEEDAEGLERFEG